MFVDIDLLHPRFVVKEVAGLGGGDASLTSQEAFCSDPDLTLQLGPQADQLDVRLSDELSRVVYVVTGGSPVVAGVLPIIACVPFIGQSVGTVTGRGGTVSP